MRIFDLLPRRLAGTSLAEPVAALHDIYEGIDAAQSRWMAATPYRCPRGCGECCLTFEPDVLEVEALYAAAYLLRSDPARAELLESGFPNAAGSGCVLASSRGEYHCTIYEARPLICRLFGFSGDRGKDGRTRFRLCSRMPADGERRLDEPALTSRFGQLPPLMGDYAGTAALILPSSSNERTGLREALPRAVAKVRYLLDLAAFSAFSQGAEDREGGDDNGDGDGDNTPPIPRAG
jgi:Fe-S-cluster containining protein